MKTDSEQLLYDGTVKFLYKDGAHKYLVSKRISDEVWAESQPVLGITTIINIIAKDSLIYWAAGVAADYMADELKKDPKTNLQALAQVARGQHRNESRKAAGIGTIGHKMIEALLLGKEVKMPEKDELKVALENVRVQFDKFEEDFKPKTIHVEQPMYSLAHNFAGTDDRFCEINGKNVLIDFKTSNRSYYNPDGLYATGFAQMGGQALLVEEMLGEQVDDLWLVNFAKDSQDYKIKSLSNIGLSVLDAKLYFLACLNLYNLNKTAEWRMSK